MRFKAVIFDMDGVLIDRELDWKQPPLSGAVALFEKLKQNDYSLAIASGSGLARIEFVVDRFGWRKYFDALASIDHVSLMEKPDPAVYLHAAKMLGIIPNKCVAVEDSVNGLNAAKAAGMSCIAALNKRWSWGDFSSADITVESLEDKRIYDYLGIL